MDQHKALLKLAQMFPKSVYYALPFYSDGESHEIRSEIVDRHMDATRVFDADQNFRSEKIVYTNCGSNDGTNQLHRS